jgi:hypothetical protein
MASVHLTRRQASLVCLTAALTALLCAGVLAAAVLVPAPPAVVPVLVLFCICCPMLAALELPRAVAALRRRGAAAEVLALDQLRRGLDRLPETEHPLGF